jgi:hypothetical protein
MHTKIVNGMDAEECRAMAQECYQLAQQSPVPEVRQPLLHLAVQWTELAGKTEVVERPERSKLH